MSAFPPPAALLPHGPAAVLLDAVTSGDASGAAATVRIRADSPYGVPGCGVPAHVGLEYMAQTCGLFAGLEAHAAGQAVRVGYLLGTRNFVASRAWFRPGETLAVSARVVLREPEMAVFACAISAAGETVAEAQLTVFQPPSQERS